MKTILIDASVIIKWYKSVREEKTKEARKFLSDHLNKRCLLSVPVLGLFELLNQAILDTELTQDQWRKIIEDFFNLSLKIIIFDEEISKETYRIGKVYGITAYDACYIACAKVYQIDFVTADKKLVKKVDLPYVKDL